MRHGSLFSGIGGFDLAAQWMGWNNVFHCEWNDFGQRVLKHYWPNAESFGDITKTDFSKYHGTIDIISGGFPCQPYSTAGKRLGKEDDRHLWPEILRAIREISPRYVVGENVRGLTNWNRGLVFDEVQADLEAQGYQVTPFLLPACAVNAPHRRDRVWFVAYRNNNDRCRSENDKHTTEAGQQAQCRAGQCICDGTASNPHCTPTGNEIQTRGNLPASKITSNPNSNQRSERRMHQTQPETAKRHTGTCDAPSNRCGTWDNFPTQSPVCSRNDGISTELDGITFPKWRNESIKAYGNAVVPQLVFEIFKAIDKHNKIQL